MKSFKQYISEASFKVNIPDMPPVYVDAKSAGEVKKKLRALLKKPMDVEVERVQPTQVKKAFRLRAQGKDEDEVQEEVDLDERMKLPRQLINKNKEVMIVKKNKVIVIDKKDQDKYMKQGWSLAEQSELDERRGRPRKDGTSGGDLENIQMQLRKSISLRGQKDVEFEDGKKVKVPEKVARQVLAGIDKMRQPKDKQIVVNYIMKSQKNLMDYATGKVKMDDMDPEAKRRKLLGLK